MTFLEPVGEMSLQNNELKSKERQVPTGDYKIQGFVYLEQVQAGTGRN